MGNSRLIPFGYDPPVTDERNTDRRLWWTAVAAAALAGLALRVVAAQGGLWTDEAWSMIYAREARDPLGVFLRINHDNNHHLYSLWLQAVGMGAPPWLARLPAIVAGTILIPLAALYAGRKSAAAGLVAALLFAVSPVFVTFGSEARGYSLMLVAALVMLLLATSSPARLANASTPWWLALCAALGMLSHLTMAAPVALIALWFYLDRREALGPRDALRTAMRVTGPAVVATAAVALLVLGAAAASPTGMRMGGYLPFRWSDYGVALDDLSAWTLGVSAFVPWLGPVLLAAVAALVALRPPAWLGARGRLYAILILGVPLAIGLVHPGNAGFPRYYLCSVLGLLLLASEWIGRGLVARGSLRALSAAALVTVLLVSLWHDSDLLEARRGRPDEAVALMALRSPLGARVSLDTPRFEAMLTVAAARAGYSLAIVNGCAPAEFAVAYRDRFAPAPTALVHCGIRMRALGSEVGTPLTGDRWILFGVQGLQTAGPPVSGPAPGALKSRQTGRAGVAQG